MRIKLLNGAPVIATSVSSNVDIEWETSITVEVVIKGVVCLKIRVVCGSSSCL